MLKVSGQHTPTNIKRQTGCPGPAALPAPVAHQTFHKVKTCTRQIGNCPEHSIDSEEFWSELPMCSEEDTTPCYFCCAVNVTYCRHEATATYFPDGRVLVRLQPMIIEG